MVTLNENQIELPEDFKFEPEYDANVILFDKPNKKGVTMKTGNGFFRRLWLLISNPFRYLFTGKIYY